MKKISALIVMAALSTFLVGCYSTSCQQPSAEPAPVHHMNVKGEG